MKHQHQVLIYLSVERDAGNDNGSACDVAEVGFHRVTGGIALSMNVLLLFCSSHESLSRLRYR
jgi:hypothetical protein